MLLRLGCLLCCCLSACSTANIPEVREFAHHLATLERLSRNYTQDIFLRTPTLKSACLCAHFHLRKTLEALEEVTQELRDHPARALLVLMQADLKMIIQRTKKGQKGTPKECPSREHGVKTAIRYYRNFFGTLSHEGCFKESQSEDTSDEG